MKIGDAVRIRHLCFPGSGCLNNIPAVVRNINGDDIEFEITVPQDGVVTISTKIGLLDGFIHPV